MQIAKKRREDRQIWFDKKAEDCWGINIPPKRCAHIHPTMTDKFFYMVFCKILSKKSDSFAVLGHFDGRINTGKKSE
jgi:hypothetical protein